MLTGDRVKGFSMFPAHWPAFAAMAVALLNKSKNSDFVTIKKGPWTLYIFIEVLISVVDIVQMSPVPLPLCLPSTRTRPPLPLALTRLLPVSVGYASMS